MAQIGRFRHPAGVQKTSNNSGWWPGLSIKRLRDERRITQEELAEKSGYSPNYISMLERGERWGSPSTLATMAEALGTDPAAIYAAFEAKADAKTPKELVSFFESPQGKARTAEEEMYLKMIRLPGRRLNETAYTLALMMIRASTPEDE